MHWSDIDFHPTSRTLRQFAALATLFLLGIAGWQQVAHGRQTLALAMAAGAVAAVVLGLIRPMALRWLFVGLTLATFPIGWLMSWLLLVALYYLVFAPIAVCFRLVGRDALTRRYVSSVASYWIDKRPVTEVRRYFRQY
jgi:hypothetical protein